MASQKFYSSKVLSQRDRRCEKRKQAVRLSDVLSSASEDSDGDTNELALPTVVSNVSHASIDNDLRDYEAYDQDLVNGTPIDYDYSSSLYASTPVTVRAATISIMQFCMDINLVSIFIITILYYKISHNSW